MNANQFTQKSAEAIQSAQALAVDYGNTQIEQEHLLTSLLSQEGGFLPRLLTSAGLDAEGLENAVVVLAVQDGAGWYSNCPASRGLDGKPAKSTSPRTSTVHSTVPKPMPSGWVMNISRSSTF